MGRTSQLAAVVFSLLITGVRAYGDSSFITLLVIIIILKLILIGYRIMRCMDTVNAVPVDVAPQTTASQFVHHSQAIAAKAFRRLAAQEQQQTSAEVTPSLPAGRYRGSRSFSDSSDREPVQYTLHFSSDGSVEGTMRTGNTGTKFGVFGVYDAEKREFQWAESNTRSFEGTAYLSKLMEISRPGYSGSERLTEASVRVVNTDTVSLVGKFISSFGARGDFRLIHSPNTDGSNSFTPQPEEVSISMETPLLQKSMSFESRMSELEPTLEKESL